METESDDEEFFDAESSFDSDINSNMSGGGSSSEEDDEMLQRFIASAARARNSIEKLLLEEIDDDDDSEKGWGGSRPGRAKNKARDFAGAYQRLVQNYFSGPTSK
jgi:hypothetical protein